MGRSLSFVANSILRNKLTLHIVDEWAGSQDDFNTEYLKVLEVRDVYDEFIQNIQKMGLSPEIHKASSQTAVTTFKDKSLQLVFLDGSHDENSVAKDLNAWGTKVAGDGILAGHDYGAKHPGLVKAINEYAIKKTKTVHLLGDTVWILK